MQQKPDLERVRAGYESIGSDGVPDPGLFDPEVEWHNARELPGATVHQGRDAMMADMRAQAEAWEERHFEPVELIETHEGAVVFVNLTAKGRSSGVPVHLELAHVLTFRDGKVVRVQAFLDRDEALRAAGGELS